MAFNALLDHDYLLSNNEEYIDLEMVIDEDDEDLDVIVEEEDDLDDIEDENNEKLLIIENQYYLEIDQARRNLQIRSHLSRVDRSEVTSKIQGYINLLSANGDLLTFLRTAGHLMDGYYRKQVRPQPLDQ